MRSVQGSRGYEYPSVNFKITLKNAKSSDLHERWILWTTFFLNRSI